MNAKAVGDRIVVKIINREDRTESGILIYRPDSKEPEHAEVLSVGDGQKTKKGKWVPSEFNVGDQVLVNKGVGTVMKLDGIDIVVLKEEEIIGFIDE